MNANANEPQQEPSYALGIANNSYRWYRNAAIRARRSHRMSAVAIQAIAASIPAVAAISPRSATIPAILGAVIVVLSSLRSIYRWQENYLRFSGAREAVEAERRLYYTNTTPYNDALTKDQTLASRVTKIEQEEMAGWIKVASEQAK
jgi:hypothetical protein